MEYKKPLLFVMFLFSVFNGVLPIIGAYITAKSLNGLVLASQRQIYEFSKLILLLIFQGVYILLQSIITQAYQMMLRLLGEKVTDHIKHMIMKKSSAHIKN